MAKGQEAPGTAEDGDVAYHRENPGRYRCAGSGVSAVFPRVSGRNTHV